MRGDGLTLVYISIFSITFAAIAGWIGYQLSEPYFPYIVFFVFFISRGLLVSAKSGYLWGEVLKNNLRILMVSILSVVLLIFGVIGLS